uniref:Uncharacterized protein MANES_02G145700 n=1 Tax=Rhizophora mucronata TaxID=61149 RepID=A0A2P2N8K9_RHIMU
MLSTKLGWSWTTLESVDVDLEFNVVFFPLILEGLPLVFGSCDTILLLSILGALGEHLA